MCEKCGHELMIDHVEESGKYVYVCTNPKCENFRKAIALTGEEYQAAIKPKGDKKERA